MIDIEAIKLLQSIHPEWVLHPLSSPKDGGNSPGKRPLLKGWQTLQKTPDNIPEYVKKGCNIGLVCGKASCVTVIDFDSDLFIPELFDGFDINTLKSKRTEGREHDYFKYNPNLPSLCGLCELCGVLRQYACRTASLAQFFPSHRNRAKC